MLEESASAPVDAKQIACKLQTKLQASEKKSGGLSTALKDTKIALADHVPMIKEKKVVADTAKSKLKEELGSLRAE